MDIAEKARAKVDDKWTNDPFALGKRGKKEEKNFVQMNIGPRNSVHKKWSRRNQETPGERMLKTTANLKTIFRSTDRSSSRSISVDRGLK